MCGHLNHQVFLSLRQFAMRNQNYGGSLAGLAPQRSPSADPNEPSSPIMALMAGPYQICQRAVVKIWFCFVGQSSSLMTGGTSSLMANPANPLHSGIRGLGLFPI